MKNSSVKIMDVYSITENGEHSNWVKVGVAFVNKDESLNVILNCIPLSGKIHIRERQKQAVKESE